LVPFKDTGEGDEGLGVFVGEVVCAGGDGLGTGAGDGGRQQLDVGFLIVDDVFEIAVVFFREAGGEEGGLGHHAETLLVEDILEMFELEGRRRELAG